MRSSVAALALVVTGAHADARNSLSRTPPMGWMSWEVFRCDIDCSKDEGKCISEWLYRNQTDALADGGYVGAGYTGIHIDDCWMQKAPRRDQPLQADAARFPSGMKALGDYMHQKGVKFGLYTAESPTTCAQYAASSDHEVEDAKAFAAWGVDYMKVDGCGDPGFYEKGYKAMGAALEASGRPIEYSCSWPAYTGDDETTKPFAEFIMDGCNLWRNYADIQCNWHSLSSIIDHWGDFGTTLAPFAGPGHWHDMDMLLVGANCLTEDEERTQMAIWAISASPLIMGNDLQKVPAASKAILLNEMAIAVNQDPLGQMGLRLPAFTSKSATQVWSRTLADGDVAVALYNKLGASGVAGQQDDAPCPATHAIRDALVEACGGGAGDFLRRRFSMAAIENLTLAEAMQACCGDDKCEGFAVLQEGRKAVHKVADETACGKPRLRSEAHTGPVDIAFNFADVGIFGPAMVYDIWTGKDLGLFDTSYTAKAVPLHGTAFLRISAAPSKDAGAEPFVLFS